MNLYQLVSIVQRKDSELYLDFLSRHSILTRFVTLCEGTAREEILSTLGLERTEKALVFAIIAEEKRIELLRGLIRELQLDVPGNGIALTIPLESVGGTASLNYFTAGQNTEKKEEKRTMEDTRFSLIITVCEKGTTDMIMNAARKVGARGGTVVPAKGTGADIAAKFFGISIAEEKELVYIVARKEEKTEIMKAILVECGPNSPAHAVAFSLPVESVVGLRSMED